MTLSIDTRNIITEIYALSALHYSQNRSAVKPEMLTGDYDDLLGVAVTDALAMALMMLGRHLRESSLEDGVVRRMVTVCVDPDASAADMQTLRRSLEHIVVHDVMALALSSDTTAAAQRAAEWHRVSADRSRDTLRDTVRRIEHTAILRPARITPHRW